MNVSCENFLAYLDRHPHTALPPAWESHVQQCPECMSLWQDWQLWQREGHQQRLKRRRWERRHPAQIADFDDRLQRRLAQADRPWYTRLRLAFPVLGGALLGTLGVLFIALSVTGKKEASQGDLALSVWQPPKASLAFCKPGLCAPSSNHTQLSPQLFPVPKRSDSNKIWVRWSEQMALTTTQQQQLRHIREQHRSQETRAQFTARIHALLTPTQRKHVPTSP